MLNVVFLVIVYFGSSLGYIHVFKGIKCNLCNTIFLSAEKCYYNRVTHRHNMHVSPTFLSIWNLKEKTWYGVTNANIHLLANIYSIPRTSRRKWGYVVAKKKMDLRSYTYMYVRNGQFRNTFRVNKLGIHFLIKICFTTCLTYYDGELFCLCK